MRRAVILWLSWLHSAGCAVGYAPEASARLEHDAAGSESYYHNTCTLWNQLDVAWLTLIEVKTVTRVRYATLPGRHPQQWSDAATMTATRAGAEWQRTPLCNEEVSAT